ncbi:MAG: MBL fold metallo-hydrolase [Gaiellaceae bacterium]
MGIELTWLGHATALVELDGVRVLTDPVLRDRIGPLVRVARSPREEDLAGIGLVLLSHLHCDHADLPSLDRLGPSTPVLAPEGAGAWLEEQGLRQVSELSAGKETTVGPLRVTATRAVHDDRRWPLVGPTAQPIGFLLRGSRSVYFAGDTDVFPDMADFAGSLDMALLPVSGWGPTLPAGHMGPDGAAAAAILMRPRLAVPIHWGTFALAWPMRPSEPDRRAHDFAALVARHAPDVEVRVLEPGGRTGMSTFAPEVAR